MKNANTTKTLSIAKPVTVIVGSDRYAGIVTELSPSGHRAAVQYGFGKPRVEMFTRRANGEYRSVGRGTLRLEVGGVVELFLDPSF